MTLTESVIFYQNYILYKLAQHLRIDPTFIKHVSLDNPKATYDFAYSHYKYEVKLSNPMLTSKEKKQLVWDFDLRGNQWIKTRTYKVKREIIESDYYVLCGMIKNVPKRIFLVPVKDTIGQSHIRISIEGKSKYEAYEI